MFIYLPLGFMLQSLLLRRCFPFLPQTATKKLRNSLGISKIIQEKGASLGIFPVMTPALLFWLQIVLRLTANLNPCRKVGGKHS